MDIKLFRAFTAYVNRANKPVRLADLSIFSSYPVADPTGQQWQSGGFCPITAGTDEAEPEFAIDVQGAALLALIQVNQRILPAAVIKEAMVKRIVEIEERDQRKANKSDYASVKDEVVGDLLPKAFIKRTFIPVMWITRGALQYVLVFTSSAKKADDVMLSLSNALNTSGKTASRWAPSLLSNCVQKDIETVLTACAKGEPIQTEQFEDGMSFVFHRSAVLKGADKQRITIKEKDIGSADVQNLLKNYDVIKLGVELYDGDIDAEASLVINDKLICSGFKVDAVSKTTARNDDNAGADLLHNLWLTARVGGMTVETLLAGMGGLRNVPLDQPTSDEPEVGSHDAQEKNSSGNPSTETPETSNDDDL